MVLQKIIFQIFWDNKDIGFVLFVLNIIYMVLRRDQLYHNLGVRLSRERERERERERKRKECGGRPPRFNIIIIHKLIMHCYLHSSIRCVKMVGRTLYCIEWMDIINQIIISM